VSSVDPVFTVYKHWRALLLEILGYYIAGEHQALTPAHSIKNCMGVE
jgi:hypothetical protein